jgi:hypothetical protein
MTLGAVVATQIGNLFAQRTEETSIFRIDFFSNWLVWLGIATELTLAVLIIYVPLLQNVFGTAALPAKNWLFLFAWTPSLLVADEVRKRNRSTIGVLDRAGGERDVRHVLHAERNVVPNNNEGYVFFGARALRPLPFGNSPVGRVVRAQGVGDGVIDGGDQDQSVRAAPQSALSTGGA